MCVGCNVESIDSILHHRWWMWMFTKWMDRRMKMLVGGWWKRVFGVFSRWYWHRVKYVLLAKTSSCNADNVELNHWHWLYCRNEYYCCCCYFMVIIRHESYKLLCLLISIVCLSTQLSDFSVQYANKYFAFSVPLRHSVMTVDDLSSN